MFCIIATWVFHQKCRLPKYLVPPRNPTILTNKKPVSDDWLSFVQDFKLCSSVICAACHLCTNDILHYLYLFVNCTNDRLHKWQTAQMTYCINDRLHNFFSCTSDILHSCQFTRYDIYTRFFMRCNLQFFQNKIADCTCRCNLQGAFAMHPKSYTVFGIGLYTLSFSGASSCWK